MSRRIEPARQVAARLEIAGRSSRGRSVRGGVDLRGDGSVEAFAQLQANVSISRADLASSGDVIKRYTITGSGLYAGVALSGSCDSASCDPATCATTATPGGGGATNTCAFDESYSGTIEVRVVK
jgi:hypothetical protein